MARPTVTPLTGDRLPFRSVLNPASSLYNDLGALGYVEEEHLVEGDGYATRILVRRPVEGWSGTVVLEPFHVVDEDTGHWTTSWRHLTRRRHAWVGATVGSGQWGPRGTSPSGGVVRLQREDPIRYAALRLDDEPEGDELLRMGTPSTHAHAALADVAHVLRRTGDVLGRAATHVIGAGWSQTGMVWTHHLDHGHSTTDVDAVWIAVAPAPEKTPPVPVVHLMSECELLGLLREPDDALPDSDQPMVRGYEVPGTFHYWQLKAHRGDQAHAAGHNDRPWWLVAHALLDHLDRFLADGTPLPHAPRVERDGDGLVRDEVGNARGGLRSPWVDVPDGTYLAGCTCSPGTGAVEPLDVVARYGSLEAYRAAFRARVTGLVTAGWLLAEDAATLHPPR
ncbi:MAG: hypothetical protein JWN29_2120 [Acidimicrobiales bacterium]|nr:hypothetical protein [Acidimicrobiales bacterium]